MSESETLQEKQAANVNEAALQWWLDEINGGRFNAPEALRKAIAFGLGTIRSLRAAALPALVEPAPSCTRGPHRCQAVCPDAFGVPCSPREGMDTYAAPPEPHQTCDAGCGSDHVGNVFHSAACRKRAALASSSVAPEPAPPEPAPSELATALRELKKRFGPYANIYEGKPERELLEATAVAIEAGSSIPVRAAPDAIDVPERADDPRWDDAVWMRTTILRFVATRGMLASAPQPERKPT